MFSTTYLDITQIALIVAGVSCEVFVVLFFLGVIKLPASTEAALLVLAAGLLGVICIVFGLASIFLTYRP